LLTGSSISFALVVTGSLLRPAYKRFRLKPENLSRALEDFGTMGGPLIPYSANALFMGSVLGISPLVYIPYTFLNILVPIVSLIYAATGFTMKKYAKDEEIPED
jgi:NhaC family Na+:H+ antiporter